MVMVNAAPASQLNTYDAFIMSEQLTNTYAKVMITSPVLDGVAKQLGLEAFPKTASVTVQPIQSTQLLTVSVLDTNPNRAAQLANTVVEVFGQQIQTDQASRYSDSTKNLESQMAGLQDQIKSTTDALTQLGNDPSKQVEITQLQATLAQYRNSYASVSSSYEQIIMTEAQSSSGVLLKDPAVPPSSPVKPQPLRDAVLAALAGMMLVAGIVYLIEFFDDTIKDPEEITQKWGLPILGIIARYDFNKNKNALITVTQPRSPVSEAFRSLRTNFQFASVDLPLRTVLVTSPSPQDGKTTIVSNLASVLAQSDHKVVVVDADLRQPKIHKMFRLPNRIGLTDQFIRNQERFVGVIRQTEIKQA